MTCAWTYVQHESPPIHPFVCQLRHNRRKRRKWRPLRRTKVWNQKRGECWGWELHVHAAHMGLIQCAASLQIRYEIGLMLPSSLKMMTTMKPPFLASTAWMKLKKRRKRAFGLILMWGGRGDDCRKQPKNGAARRATLVACWRCSGQKLAAVIEKSYGKAAKSARRQCVYLKLDINGLVF